jgi:hypothetical protein
MAPPSIPTLPPEIIDIVTDFLFDDKSTLANMTLVCKAFLPSARLHLFDTLIIATYQFWELVEDGVQVSEISDIFASFASLVHHLEFRDHEDDGELQGWMDVFLPCLSLLKSVTILSLRHFGWKARVEIRNELFTCFSGVSELTIICGWFPDIVLSTLQFPLLEGLHLGFVSWELEDNLFSYHLAQENAAAFSNLSSLSIGGVDSRTERILYWMLSLEKMPLLHTLCITTVAFNKLDLAGQLIRTFAPTLKHLTLTFWSYGEILLRESAS